MFGIFSSTPTASTAISTHLTEALKGNKQSWDAVINVINNPKALVSDTDKALLKELEKPSLKVGEKAGARETLLGFCYRRNLWKQSYEEQKRNERSWFMKGAEKGFSEGQYQAGKLNLASTFISEANHELGFHYLTAAYHQHHPEATIALAELHNNIHFGFYDVKKAEFFYNEAQIVHLHAAAAVPLANLRLARATSQQEIDANLAVLNEETALGNKDASYSLGQHYLKNGKDGLAREAFEKAVAQNHVEAKIALAELLVTGKGGAADRKQALLLIRAYCAHTGSTNCELLKQHAAAFCHDHDPEALYQYAMMADPANLTLIVQQPIEIVICYVCNDSFLSINEQYGKMRSLIELATQSNPALSLNANVQIARAICNVAKRIAAAIDDKNTQREKDDPTVTAIDGITNQNCLDLLSLIPKSVPNYDGCCRTFTEIAYQFASVTRTKKIPSFIPLIHAYFYMKVNADTRNGEAGPLCLSFMQSCSMSFLSKDEITADKHTDFSFLATKVFNVKRLSLMLTEMQDLIDAENNHFDEVYSRKSSQFSLSERLLVPGFKLALDWKRSGLSDAIKATIPDIEPKRRDHPQQQIEKFDAMLTQLLTVKKSINGITTDFDSMIDRIYNVGVLFSFNMKQLHPELGLSAGAAPVVGNAVPAGAVAVPASAAATNTSTLTPPRRPGM